MKRFAVVLLALSGCGEPARPDYLAWDGFAAGDVPTPDGGNIGLLANWAWNEKTGASMYGVAVSGTRVRLHVNPNARYVIVSETKVAPPPEDGFLYLFSAPASWTKTDVKVDELRSWHRSPDRPSGKDDPMWRDRLVPLALKHRLK